MFEQALAPRLEAEEVQPVVAVAEKLLLDPLLAGSRPKHAPAHTTYRTAGGIRHAITAVNQFEPQPLFWELGGYSRGKEGGTSGSGSGRGRETEGH